MLKFIAKHRSTERHDFVIDHAVEGLSRVSGQEVEDQLQMHLVIAHHYASKLGFRPRGLSVGRSRGGIRVHGSVRTKSTDDLARLVTIINRRLLYVTPLSAATTAAPAAPAAPAVPVERELVAA